MTPKSSGEKTVREIRRKTRRKHSAEEKIRIIMDGDTGWGVPVQICFAKPLLLQYIKRCRIGLLSHWP